MIWSKTNAVSETHWTVFSGIFSFELELSLMELSTWIVLTSVLDFSRFSISCIFEAVFPYDCFLDFGHLMLFLNHDNWNCFWTAVSGANGLYNLLWRKTYNIQTWKYEKASLIFVWNVCKKSLVSMLHCLKQLLWNRIVRGIFAPGIRKSDSLFTDILIDVWRLLFSTACSVGFHVFHRKLLKPGRSELLLDKLFKRDFSYCSAIEVF